MMPTPEDSAAGQRRTDAIGALIASKSKVDTFSLPAKFARCLPGALYQLHRTSNGGSRFTFVSERFINLFEILPGSAGRDAAAVFDRIHPDDRAMVEATLEASVRTMQPCHFDYRVILPIRGTRMHSTVATPEPAEDGGIMWYGHVSDVTGTDQTRDHNKYADILFAHSSIGIIVTDADNTIIDVNPAFELITGYAWEEVIGQNPRILSSGRQPASFYRDMWRTLNETGAWVGEINNRRKNGEIYVERLQIKVIHGDGNNSKRHVAFVSDITREHQAEATMRRLCSIDPLTGLANRHVALEQLSLLLDQAQRHEALMAVLVVNLDHFKTVNDQHGHQIGDEVLISVADRFRSIVRDFDVLARLSGGEFLIGIGGISELEEAATTADRLIQTLAEPIHVGELQIIVTPSIGISVSPSDGTDLTMLVKYAEEAMYAAKADGRHRYRFFSSAMHHRALSHARLSERLRKAVLHRSFELHYQEQVNINTGQLISFEALIRPTVAGLGSPGEFIPLAEELNLIQPLGRFTIEHAIRQMASWTKSGAGVERIAINVSPRQFVDPQLVDTMSALLDETGLPPTAIEIEVTETTAMHDAEEAIKLLRRFKDLGVLIAIDDFGTGYSSLAYLRRFPIDRIKIDRAFVNHLETQSDDVEIVKAIISLAQAMKLSVLAEGIETEGQRTILAGLGCELAQGYLFGKPKPANQIAFLPLTSNSSPNGGMSWTSH